MKNFKYLLLITVVLSIVFAACKYEEGPGISLRQKRERVSGAWKVTNCLVDGVSDAAMLASFSYGASATTSDSLQIIFSITQSGSYSMNLQYTESYAASSTWRKYYIANQTGLMALTWDHTKNTFFKLIGSNGKWTFHNKWKEIHFGTYDLSYSEGEAKPLKCTIVMLKNEMLKLSYVDMGKTYVLTFEPHKQ